MTSAKIRLLIYQNRECCILRKRSILQQLPRDRDWNVSHNHRLPGKKVNFTPCVILLFLTCSSRESVENTSSSKTFVFFSIKLQLNPRISKCFSYLILASSLQSPLVTPIWFGLERAPLLFIEMRWESTSHFYPGVFISHPLCRITICLLVKVINFTSNR